jgi:hypothetical protein
MGSKTMTQGVNCGWLIYAGFFLASLNAFWIEVTVRGLSLLHPKNSQVLGVYLRQ